MKKFRFFLVSAVLAGVSLAANAGERVSSLFVDYHNDSQIEKKGLEQLVLQPALDNDSQSSFLRLNGHQSHRSHSSHSSHRSHYSSR